MLTRKLNSSDANAEDVICTVDFNGVVTSVNSVVRKIVGYEPEEIIGRHFTEFVSPTDHEITKKMFDKVLNGESSGTGGLEFSVFHKNGGVRWAELNGRIVFDDDGNPIELEGILRDITRAHEAEIQLRESEKQYRLLFENAAEAIFVADREGKCLNANKAMCDLLGFSDCSDVEGKPLTDFIPEEFLESYGQIVKKVVGESNFSSIVENVVFLSREQTHVIAEVKISRVSDRLYMGIARNITGRKAPFSATLIRRFSEEPSEQ